MSTPHEASGAVDVSVDADGVPLRVRAVLLDAEGNLVLFERTRPGRAVYYSTPGGGVEPGDADLESALRRELDEELRAEVTAPIWLMSVDRVHDNGKRNRHHVFVCRLLSMRPAERYGPEFTDPAKGGYAVVRVPCTQAGLTAVDLHPASLKEYLLTHLDEIRSSNRM